MITVHETVARGLTACGVDTMFGVMGDANMLYITDFMGDGGRYVGAADERGAVLMAVGRARITQRAGVVTVTHGPGITNAMTSLFEAARSRTPIVVLTGDTPLVRDYLQRVDIAGLVAPSGALYRRVLSEEYVADDVVAALRTAEAERLPVVLDIPYHLLRMEVQVEEIRVQAVPRQQVSASDDALDVALGVIASAKRPVILAGRGAAQAGARDALLALAEVLGAPVATTLLGRDLFRDTPYDLGVLGTVSHDLALDVVGASDCVIAFGAGLNQYTTSHGWLAKGRALVQVDSDPASIGRHTSVTAAVIGDAQAVASRMSELLGTAGYPPTTFRGPELARRLAERDPRGDFRDTSDSESVDVRSAMIRLDEILPADRIVVTDVGRFAMAPWRYLRVPEPLSFTHTASFGSIGLGLATAIGAATVDAARTTVAIVGDGGAMMSLLELSTAVRHGVRLVIIVVNDRCYGAEWSQLEKFGVDPKYSLIDWPSFAEVASALGAQSIVARSVADLDAIPAALTADRLPLLVDLRIDPAVAIGEIR